MTQAFDLKSLIYTIQMKSYVRLILSQITCFLCGIKNPTFLYARLAKSRDSDEIVVSVFNEPGVFICLVVVEHSWVQIGNQCLPAPMKKMIYVCRLKLWRNHKWAEEKWTLTITKYPKWGKTCLHSQTSSLEMVCLNYTLQISRGVDMYILSLFNIRSLISALLYKIIGTLLY